MYISRQDFTKSAGNKQNTHTRTEPMCSRSILLFIWRQRLLCLWLMVLCESDRENALLCICARFINVSLYVCFVWLSTYICLWQFMHTEVRPCFSVCVSVSNYFRWVSVSYLRPQQSPTWDTHTHTVFPWTQCSVSCCPAKHTHTQTPTDCLFGLDDHREKRKRGSEESEAHPDTLLQHCLHSRGK